MRCAEQRWPALWNAETMVSSTTCSGSAEESTIMALTPPVSAMSGTIGPSRPARLWLIFFAVSTEPVKATPAMRGSATRRAPMAPSPIAPHATSAGMPAS